MDKIKRWEKEVKREKADTGSKEKLERLRKGFPVERKA